MKVKIQQQGAVLFFRSNLKNSGFNDVFISILDDVYALSQITSPTCKSFAFDEYLNLPFLKNPTSPVPLNKRSPWGLPTLATPKKSNSNIRFIC